MFVTARATGAFAVARECGLDVDPRVLPEVRRWLDAQLERPDGLVEATDPRAATAAVLWARVRCGDAGEPSASTRRALEALAELQSERTAFEFVCELDGTLFGSLATYAGGHAPAWKTWRRSLSAALADPSKARARSLRGNVAALLCTSVHLRHACVLVR